MGPAEGSELDVLIIKMMFDLPKMAARTRQVEILDTDTGKQITVPIDGDTINSRAFQELGLCAYDNGYMNTAVCKSSISYIDGNKGILRYRFGS